MTVEHLMALLPDERRKTRIRKRQRGPYERRPSRSRDELITFLCKNGVTSSRQLQSFRKPLEPTVYDFQKYFGAWSTAVAEAHGEQLGRPEPPSEPIYIIRAVIEFDLWSQKKYFDARAKRPDVIPSSNQVRKLFGKFSNLFALAERESLKKTFENYLSLQRRLGRRPTAQDIRQEGLDLTIARKIFGGKAQFDQFISSVMTEN